MPTFCCCSKAYFFFLSLSLILCVQGGHYSRVSSIYYRTLEADKLNGWATANKCFEACGLTKYMRGITSDVLSDPRFTKNLCSTMCYHGCPNVAEHYFKLAAGEGDLQRPGTNAVRKMVEIGNRGWRAFGSMEKMACAPTQSEEPLTGN